MKKFSIFTKSKVLWYSSVRWLAALLFVGFLPAITQAQTITGTVFRDFNADGTRTAIPASGTYAYGEPGVPGVIVTAYSTNSATVPISATTNASGAYSLNVGSAAQFRLEFTNLVTGDFDGFIGANSKSNVQFVNGGTSAVNLGINYPPQYCGIANPFLITSCYTNGNPTAPSSATTNPANDAWMVGWLYDGTPDSRNNYLAKGNIGATWGLAYQRSTKLLFAAAIMKRHSGFGTGGPGQIYAINMTNPASASASITAFVNLKTDLNIEVGTDPRIADPLPINKTTPNHDAAAFDLVGKMSLGDIDISDDERTLWVMNLFDQSLYELPIGMPATKPTTFTKHTLPAGGCVNGTLRAFATKFYRGKVYVGAVCSGEGSTGTAANLTGLVYAHDPAGATSNFTQVLSFPLNYTRGFVTSRGSNSGTGTVLTTAAWRPWIDQWTDIPASFTNTGYTQTVCPQPVISDLEFDVNGEMIVGLFDRFGHQAGNNNYSPITSSTLVYEATAAGDMLRAGRKADGTYQIENNASVINFAANGAASVTESSSAVNQTLPQGPGGGEFYWQDMFDISSSPNSTTSGASPSSGHQEILVGGLALWPGTGEVVATAFDPFTNFRAAGARYFNNVTGESNFEYQVLTQDGGLTNAQRAATFGKAASLGDLEVLCVLPPIQIGNRVWRDTDNDGVQDAGEPTLAGVVVTLKGPGLPPAGTTVVTGTNGEYYFSNASGTNALGFVYSLTGLTSGGSYSLSFPSSASAGVLSLSPKANAATGANADAIDTDVNLAGVISFTLGQAGENNFTYDAAYVPTPPCLVSLTTTPGTCQSATNQYILTGTVNFTSTPGGILTISDDGVNTPVVSTTVSVPAGATSIAFSLTGLGSGGRYHIITASFSTTACGTQSMTYLSPVSCTAAPCVGPNLLVNPSFEQAFVAPPTGQVTQSPPIGWIGGTADNNQQSSAAPDGYAYAFSTDNGSLCQSVSATVGSTYNLVFYAGVHQANGQTVTLSFLNSSSAVIGTPKSFTNTYILESTFSFGGPYSLSGVAPAGTTQVRVCAVSAAGTGSNFWSKIDNLCLTGTTPPCSMSVAVSTPVCNSATNNYAATGTVSLSNTPAGSLTITDNGVTVGIVSVTAGQTSATFSVSGISNAASHTITVSSSNATCGIASQTYAAPVSCSVAPCGLSLTVTPGLCQTVTNRYTLSMQVAATNVPGSGTLTTSSLAFSPAFTQSLSIGNSSGSFSFSGLVSNGQVFTVTSAFSNTTCAPVSQTFAAPASCSVAPVCSLTATPTAGLCQTATNTFSSTVSVQIANPGAGGVLVVTDGGLSQTITVGAGLGSFVGTAVFGGLPSDGQSRTVTVSLPGCSSISAAYLAPVSCSVGVPCSALLAITPGICSTLTNTYSATAVLTANNIQAPRSVTVTVDGQSQVLSLTASGINTVTYELNGLVSDGQVKTATAIFSGTACASASTTFAAPASCSIAPVCSLTVTPTAGLCQTATNTYSSTVVVQIANTGLGGVLTVTDGSISQTLAVGAGLTSFTGTAVFNNLTSDGQGHIITASLPGCSSLTGGYTAPVSCSVALPCSATLAVTPGICSTLTNTYSATATLQLANVVTPQTVTITVGGVSSAPVSLSAGNNIVTFIATNLTSDGLNHIATAAFSGTACASASTTFAAPVSCTVCSLSLTTSMLANGQVGTAYSETLTASGGTTPVTFTISAGGLPIGLSLDGATGVISGTPTSATTASFTLTVTDAKNCSIVAPLTITTTADPVCSLTVTATPGICNTATNTYIVTGTVSATNGPGSQSLTISVGGVNTVVTLASTSGPVGYTLAGLPSDGAVATVTVLSSATACGMTSVTYTAPASCSAAPLTPSFILAKLVSKSKAKLGDVISYTVVIANTGPVSATSVVVNDSFTSGLSLIPGSTTVSDGSYTPGLQGGTWAIASLPVGGTATLTYSASIMAEGVIYNTASIPGDEAQVCTSVPFAVCKDTPFAIALSVASGYSRYQWYYTAPNSSSSTVVADGTLNSFTATLAGEYKVIVDEGLNGRCAQLACCPILIEEVEVPQYTVQGKNPTCVGTTPQSNGEITLMNLGVDPTVYFYQLSAGSSFSASTAIPAQPTPVPANGIVATGLADGTYTVRVWVLVDGQPSCPRDVTVTLRANCACPEEICVPITIRKVRR